MKKKSVAARNDKVSSNNNNYIPDDIAFSILSKLPLKSFKRFECVNKSWSLLFENHRFFNMFRNHHFMKMFRDNILFNSSNRCSYYEDASILLKDYGNGLYSLYGHKFENKVKLDSPFGNHDGTRYLGFGSVNGILLDSEKYMFWNPATPALKLLPESMVFESLNLSDDDYSMLYHSTYFNGFGYDDVTDDYKVIRYVSVTGKLIGVQDMSVEVLGYESLCSFWEICSLRSDTWRKLETEMPPSFDCFEGSQVYMDGVCHWFCGEDSPDGNCVVSFYLSNEEFFVTPIPSDDDYYVFDETSWINLVVLNGFIALFSYHKDTTFHISILGEFGVEESWTKLLTIGPLPCVERPFGVGTKGEIFFVRKDEELAWLDLGTQMIVELGYKVDPYSSQIIIYKESILPFERIRDLFFAY
jgi:molecular chaperone HtpG